MDDLVIDIEQDSNIKVSTYNWSEMESSIQGFIDDLSIPPDIFDETICLKVCNEIKDYIEKYDRILYSTISNRIFHLQKDKSSGKNVADIITNLDKLIKYCWDNGMAIGEDGPTKLYKIILKTWDHVNLAQQQYQELYLSDQDYQEKFRNQMKDEKTTLYREINSHMVTMIGIFTALSFVIFGGINSIETAFSGIEDTPITKLMVIGCVWGFGLLNLVYIFLYCIAKLNNLNFKNHVGVNANFVQRYQFIVIPNIAIIGLLLLSLWMYFAISNRVMGSLINWCQENQLCFIFLSVLVFLCLLGRTYAYILNKIEQKNDNS